MVTMSQGYYPVLIPLWEMCIKQLIQNNKLECPECKMKHDVTNEEKSFVQNKYILTCVSRKAASAEEGKIDKHL